MSSFVTGEQPRPDGDPAVGGARLRARDVVARGDELSPVEVLLAALVRRLSTGADPARGSTAPAPASTALAPESPAHAQRHAHAHAERHADAHPRTGAHTQPHRLPGDGVFEIPLDTTTHPADQFAGMTGPLAADRLAALIPGDLDDFTLGEALRMSERLVSWGAAVQARIIQEMTARAGSSSKWVRDEVAALLQLTGRAADVVTHRAALLEAVPEAHDALARGHVDVRRVDSMARTTAHLSFERARHLIGEVLPRAGDLTGPGVRDALREAEAAEDPSALEERARLAREDRCVSMTPAPDAMAWVTAYLPAADATAVWAAVDAMAQQTGECDGRSPDQRRADAFVAVMRQVLDTGVGPDGAPLPTTQGRRPHLSVIADLELLRPGAVGVAELEGYGPVPATVAQEIAADASWTVTPVDRSTGEAAGAPRRVPRRTVRRVLDRLSEPRPHDDTRAADDRPSTPGGDTGAPSADDGPDGRLPNREWPAGVEIIGSTSQVAGEPGSTATGDGEPSEDDGDPWRGYRPSALMRAAVLARDRTCTFPGCRRPAVRCDLDHIVPFDPTRPAAEQTRPENLHALCRWHHQLKTHGGWQVERDPRTGVTTWTSPSGHVYTRTPAPFGPRHGPRASSSKRGFGPNPGVAPPPESDPPQPPRPTKHPDPPDEPEPPDSRRPPDAPGPTSSQGPPDDPPDDPPF